MRSARFLTCVLLTTVAAAHVVRAGLGVPVMVGDLVVPMWGSWLGAVVAGGLAIGLWREGKETH